MAFIPHPILVLPRNRNIENNNNYYEEDLWDFLLTERGITMQYKNGEHIKTVIIKCYPDRPEYYIQGRVSSGGYTPIGEAINSIISALEKSRYVNGFELMPIETDGRSVTKYMLILKTI